MSKKLIILCILLLTSCNRQHATDAELEVLLSKEKVLIEKKERFIAEINLFRARLFEDAATFYKFSTNDIKRAAVIQERIDRLKDEGKTDDDAEVQELIGERNGLLESAKKSFEAGYDAEYLARHGRDRPKPLENGKIILKP